MPVHLVNGAWGVLAVGIFANGNPDTAAWNGVESAVTGLLYGGTTQILAQLAEVVSIFVVVFGLSYLFFKVCMLSNCCVFPAKMNWKVWICLKWDPLLIPKTGKLLPAHNSK